jgi:2,3-bisphosphoglycerate-dependent phosphoglycerate mutase
MTDANLVIVRHGQSEWNRDRRMTGWSDVALNARGREEARDVGRLLRQAGCRFDLAWTSWLQRAAQTLEIVLEELGQPDLPVHRDWRLNERHYGAMQGMSRQQAAREFGLRQYAGWQSGFALRPPAVSEDDPRYPGNDPRYAGIDPASLPVAESMEDTLGRVMPCWREDIVPALRAGQRVLVVAHKTSVRVLRKHLEGISDEGISALTVRTGEPLLYHLDADLRVRWQRSLNPSGRFRRFAQAALARWIHSARPEKRV